MHRATSRFTIVGCQRIDGMMAAAHNADQKRCRPSHFGERLQKTFCYCAGIDLWDLGFFHLPADLEGNVFQRRLNRDDHVPVVASATSLHHESALPSALLHNNLLAQHIVSVARSPRACQVEFLLKYHLVLWW